MEKFTNLNDVFKTAWNLIYRAAISRNDPMRTPVLATVAEGHPHQRTIVLREVDTTANLLYFFSDLRAPKVTQLQQECLCNLIFWDPRKKVQIELRANGRVLHQTPPNKKFWDRINVGGRTSYATIHPPGTKITQNQPYLPEYWKLDMNIQETTPAYEHFAVLELEAYELDVLHLHQEGHQRCLFKKVGHNWEMDWLVP